MPDIRYDNDLYLRMLEDFLDQVVGRPATIVPVGSTAAYGAQLAVDRPDLVRAIALVTPRGLVESNSEPRLGDALLDRLLRLPVFGTATVNLLTSREALARHLHRDLFFRADRVDAGTLEHFYRSSHQPGAHRALAAYLSGYLNHPIDAALPRMTSPTVLIWGRRATAPALELADLWLSRIEHATLEVLDDCGSHPHAERPQAFARRLRTFLDRIEG
jgi:pimeloyl-ACP methyl ester carboxylesterase